MAVVSRRPGLHVSTRADGPLFLAAVGDALNSPLAQSGNETTVSDARPRRPTERVRLAVVSAAKELIDERGFSALTVDEVASRSGVSKMTIYRWWNNRSAVAMDVLLEAAGPNTPMLHEGSALSNLRTHLLNAVGFLSGPSSGLLAGVIADAQHDEELSEELRNHYLYARRSMTLELVKRAMVEGDVRQDVDAEVVLDLLIGPLYYRLLFGHLPVDEAFMATIVDTLLRGISSPT
jgi:AcrR family transcriptional regulator